MSERFFKLSELSRVVRLKHNLFLSKLVPKGAQIRGGDLQLTVISTDDSKNQLILKWEGVWLQPKEGGENGAPPGSEPVPVIILPPGRTP